MNPPEVSESQEIKLPCTNIIVNELDNPAISIPPIHPKKTIYTTLIKAYIWLIAHMKLCINILWTGLWNAVITTNKYVLTIYFAFSTILLICVVSKTYALRKAAYYWIALTCMLFLIKVIEFLQSYRNNNMRSFELLDTLENQIRLTQSRNLVRQSAHGNPFIENFLRNQNLMHVLNNNNHHHFSRFSEYNTVFNNILRLRVHVLAMRMNMMMHALGVFPDGDFSLNNNDPHPNGMMQHEIDDLNYEIYHKGDKDEDPECTICLETVNEEEEVRVLECGHTFHKLCIDKWLILQRYCPYCRTIV